MTAAKGLGAPFARQAGASQGGSLKNNDYFSSILIG